MNYIPDAVQHGAQVFTNVEVQSIQPQQQSGSPSWLINCLLLADDEQTPLDAPVNFTVTADIVVLAAGSLGSTEILLRSAAQGHLPSLSPQLGKNFGSDGDFFGVAYNTSEPVRDIGFGDNTPSEMYNSYGRVGPCICSVYDLRDPNQPLENGFILEDMAIPGALGEIASNALIIGSKLYGKETDNSQKDIQDLRTLEGLLGGPYRDGGAPKNTLLIGGMSHDNQQGVMSLNTTSQGANLVIDWPNCVDPTQNATFLETLQQVTANLSGIFVKDPLSNPLIPLIQSPIRPMVHPLGGCIMADSAEDGVVNNKVLIATY